MTKKEYLRQLEEEIILIDEDIADDIIDYYKLRFEEGKRFESKTAEEITEELGTPKELAKRIYASYDIREDLWESAREDDVELKKAVPVILFDLLVGTWLIPLIIFLILTGFASFVTFPFVIAAIPGLVIRDALLVILLAIGTYSILLLLVLGISEVGVVVVKNILIWNLKVLSPRNKTTARMIKRVSLFQWMRQVKMGRNIFINLGMVAISLISISFILLSNYNSDVFSIFGTQAVITRDPSRDLAEEIALGEVYTLNIDVGDVDVQLVENLSTEVRVTHKYSLEDGFFFEVDTEKNVIVIRTYQEQVNEGLFNNYEASTVISIPEELILESVNIVSQNGDIDVLHYESDVLNIENNEGDIYMYNPEVGSSEIVSKEGSITVLDGFVKELYIVSVDSFVNVSDVNNMLNDGSSVKIDIVKGEVNLRNTYFKVIEVETLSANINLKNENDVYVIEELITNSTEGIIIVEAPYQE